MPGGPGGQVRPHLSLRQPFGGRLSVPSEVRCDGASVSLISQTAGQAARRRRSRPSSAKSLSCRRSTTRIADRGFKAPATIAGPGQPSMIANWSKARSSVVGLPTAPQRISLVFDDPSIDRTDVSPPTPLARAKHIELHGRLVDGQPLIIPILKPCCGSSRAACRRCIRCSPSRSMPTCGRS